MTIVAVAFFIHQYLLKNRRSFDMACCSAHPIQAINKKPAMILFGFFIRFSALIGRILFGDYSKISILLTVILLFPLMRD